MNRREFVATFGAFPAGSSGSLRPIVVSVNAMFDQGAHSRKGLGEAELSKFKSYQEKAGREYAVSGIRFEVRVTEGAFLREEGSTDIPERFLAAKAINLFVTETLRYDIDRSRTGGCSTGPHPPMPKFGADGYYKTFLGLREAGENTLAHEYAHHFSLDTRRRPTAAANFWADLRNDYLLWWQRHGVAIMEFRACADSEWARLEMLKA